MSPVVITRKQGNISTPLLPFLGSNRTGYIIIDIEEHEA